MTHSVSAEAAIDSPASNTGNNQQDYLFISRSVDFLMLGGLSILIWFPIYFLQDDISLVNSFALAIPGVALPLAYWINYPHFMASYKLAYLQGKGFISDNWFQLIFVPAALIILIFVSFNNWSSSVADNRFVIFFNLLFETLGLKTRVGLYPNLGSEILGSLILLLYFTVGWHYSKQTFGCMMVYAKLDNYRLGILERNIIRYALLSTWWVGWLYSNCSEGSYPFYGLEVHRLNLPYVWFQASYVITSALFIATAGIFLRNYIRSGKAPSVNFLVPMVALLIWHIPLFTNPQFFYILALFHSLQYFPFVAKIEKARYKRDNLSRVNMRLLIFFALMMFFGFIAFDYTPNSFDDMQDAFNTPHASFFMIAILIFINVHHYFIDNVLWRFKNKEVRDLLFD